jgi:ADP-ribose pyrophosphatase YjhB (NUDIX family)
MNIDRARLYQIADEIRAAAVEGLRYSQNGYEKERCERFLNASARLAAMLEARPVEEVQAKFAENLFHISPVSTVDAVVMRKGKLLLIRRRDNGLWAMPGGACEVGENLAQGAERELWEETGIRGRAVRLLAVFDSRKWHTQTKVQLYMNVFQVESDDPLPEFHNPAGETSPHAEVLDVDFFDPLRLPKLSPDHHVRIPVVLKALNGEIPVPFFDA